MAFDRSKGSDLMADLEDVLTAVYDQVVRAVYPNGVMEQSVAGVDVTIVKGWPIKNKLEDQMFAGKAIVSIFPTNMESDITKFERIDKPISTTPATLIFTIENLQITVGGTISVPQSIILTVDTISYQYTVLISDTLDSIATSIAGLIPGATSSGTIVTLPYAYDIVINVATPALTGLDLGRQEQQFMISCWCPTPTIRAALAPPIDNYMRINYQFPIAPDNFNIMIFYVKTQLIDKLEMPLIYRRDLYYKIQYSTTQLNTYTTIASTVTNYSVTPGGSL